MKSANQSVRPVTAKVNDKNHLEIGGCDMVELAKEYGTPLYVMDEQTIRKICGEYRDAFSSYENTMLLYASKAFISLATIKILKEEGFGLEVVSAGEIVAASRVGFPMEKISFNGNNKTVEELIMALDMGIGRIVVDNFFELEMLHEIAEKTGKNPAILLRITPGIECHTHEYIKTGQQDSKFGFDLSQIDEAVNLIVNKFTNLEIKGLHAHIGSQIFETQVYYDEINIILEQFAAMKDRYGVILDEINAGGGPGIRYIKEDRPPSTYMIAEVILDSLRTNVKRLGIKEPKLILEPGRSIVGTAGVTLYSVGSWKQVPGGTRYLAVDGGMADNPRPAMYQAKYEAVVAGKASDKPCQTVTIAGRYCESGDILIKNINLPKIEYGDIICVFNTGAYNYSMSSNYNSVPKPAVVMVNKGEADLIIERETFDDLLQKQMIPKRFREKASVS